MTSQPCVWMSAGLISYKLCSHEFDCDHCPLDAALREHVLQDNPTHSHEALGKFKRHPSQPAVEIFDHGCRRIQHHRL